MHLAWGAQAFGALLILLSLEDIFFTVLFPGSKHGLVRELISRGGWRVFVTVSRLAGRARRRRRRVLTYCGPILIAAHVTVWVVLFIVGFALIVWPVLGTTIRAASGKTSMAFITAVYYSGFAFTTLGTGDIVPKTGPYRVLMILEAVLGFASITLVLTYFQSVYNALVSRNTFILSLHARTARTNDPAVLLAGLGPGGDFTTSTLTLSVMGTEVLHVFEAQRAYPILRYFHFRHGYESLPHLLYIPLDTAALIRSALDPEQYRSVVESAAVAEIWEGGLHELGVLTDNFLPRSLRPSTGEDARVREGCVDRWRAHYAHARDCLRRAGINLEPDEKAGAQRYIEMRHAFDAQLVALAQYLTYSLDEVLDGGGHAEQSAPRDQQRS